MSSCPMCARQNQQKCHTETEGVIIWSCSLKVYITVTVIRSAPNGTHNAVMMQEHMLHGKIQSNPNPIVCSDQKPLSWNKVHKLSLRTNDMRKRECVLTG
ncbi:hypothetical protein PO909_023918 [Leuciscus waleckii]